MDALIRKKLAPILKLMEKPNIKELVINRPQEVGLEKTNGQWEWHKVPYLTARNLNDMAGVLATQTGQKYNVSNALLSCKLPANGHRVQVIGAPYALDHSKDIEKNGFAMTIRVNRQDRYPVEAFNFGDVPEINEDYGALDIKDQIQHVKEAVKQKKTILVSGGTSTGKTTFLNELIQEIPEAERIVTIEGVNELKVSHKNWTSLIYSENKTSLGAHGVAELLNATLRMRPDRIILGEIRKENAYTFIRAINTGHEGSLATVHANTPQEAIEALITNCIMNGDIPDSAVNATKKILIKNIYGIVQINRVEGKMRAYFDRIKESQFK